MGDQDKPDTPHENAPAKGTATQTKPRRSPRKRKPKPLPPWKVILHNDDVNDHESVVTVIRKLTPLDEDEATQRMMEADRTGAALLLVTHRERAELYVEQFASCKLTCTSEPDA